MERLVPLKGSGGGKDWPKAPANVRQRMLCIAVKDLGLVKQNAFTLPSGKQIPESTRHMIQLIHETRMTFNSDKPEHKDFNGRPFLIFSRISFYFGSESTKKTGFVSIAEAHLKRDLTDKEKWGDPNTETFNPYELIGKTVQGVPKHNKRGYPYIPAGSWQYDLDENGNELESWDAKAEWPPKKREADTSFNFGSNKTEENSEENEPAVDDDIFD